MGSSLYESWVTQLRLSWMGTAAQRIFGGFAAVLGDFSIDWSQAAIAEQNPITASPKPIALMASSRQLDTAPGEDSADIAAREPYWLLINRFRGRPLGLLLGLHFAGFDGGVIITQNGMAFSLSLPLPAFGENWDPTPNLVRTALATLAVPMHSDRTLSRSIPAGNSWWTFDSNTDLCSRFGILFPGVLPSVFLTWGRAVFTGVENGTTIPWPTVTWNNVFDDTSYDILPGWPTVTDGGGGVSVQFDPSTKTQQGVQVAASAPFKGSVDFIAWRDAQNPFADLHPADLARLQALVQKWRPARAICTGVYARVQGNYVGWPVRTAGTAPPGAVSIVAYPGGF